MTKELDAKLKPCPFCGGMRPHACICARRWAVRCPECGAMVMSDSADDGGRSAAERWNARASEEDRRTVRTCRLIDNGAELCCSNCDCRYGYGEYVAFCRNCGRKVEE